MTYPPGWPRERIDQGLRRLKSREGERHPLEVTADDARGKRRRRTEILLSALDERYDPLADVEASWLPEWIPATPIGAGARWSQDEVFIFHGLRLRMRYDFVLAAVSEDEWTVKITMLSTGAASARPVYLPALKLNVTSIAVSGEAELHLSSKRMAPIRSREDVELKVAFDGGTASVQRKMVMRIHTSLQEGQATTR